MGLDQHERSHRYHHVLSRASWSSRKVSGGPLGLPVRTFAPEGPLLVGIDESRKRRWGKKISPRGVYRESVRCTHENLVNSSKSRPTPLVG
jgi:hypothetical protein